MVESDIEAVAIVNVFQFFKRGLNPSGDLGVFFFAEIPQIGDMPSGKNKQMAGVVGIFIEHDQRFGIAVQAKAFEADTALFGLAKHAAAGVGQQFSHVTKAFGSLEKIPLLRPNVARDRFQRFQATRLRRRFGFRRALFFLQNATAPGKMNSG
jgi:hypothetical protein